MPASRPEPGATEVAIAIGLAAVAGAVDVLAFTRLGQAFASIITGNVVVIGVSIGQMDLAMFGHVATAVGAYAVGVLLGSVVIRAAGPVTVRWPRHATYLCAAEALVLVAAAVIWLASYGAPAGAAQYVTLVLAAGAMGLQSAAFRLAHVPGVATTYFTGTLTGLLAGLVTESRLNRPALYALVALLVGAALAGVLVAHAPRFAVLLPLVVLAGVLGLAVARRDTLAQPSGQ